MTGWVGNIEDATNENEFFRQVLFTGRNTQLTVMAIQPGDEIGEEMHDHLDQFIRVESGSARITLGSKEGTVDETHDVVAEWAAIIPGGTWHNVINSGDDVLKLYSLYSPPEHEDGTVHRTKADAERG